MRKTLETADCDKKPSVLEAHYKALAEINATAPGGESWRGRQGLLVDTVMEAGRDLYPRLRPHLLKAIDNDDTVMDDILLALLDQLMGYDEIHRGRGVLVGLDEVAATQRANALEDQVRLFLEQRCLRGPHLQVRFTALYEAYARWAADRNSIPVGLPAFVAQLGVVDPDLGMVPAAPPGEMRPGAEPTLQGVALRQRDEWPAPLQDQWEVFTDKKPAPRERIRWNIAGLPDTVGGWLLARCASATAGAQIQEERLTTLWGDYAAWCDNQASGIEWGSTDLLTGLVVHLDGVEAIKHRADMGEGEEELFLRGIRLKAFDPDMADQVDARVIDEACGIPFEDAQTERGPDPRD